MSIASKIKHYVYGHKRQVIQMWPHHLPRTQWHRHLFCQLLRRAGICGSCGNCTLHTRYLNSIFGILYAFYCGKQHKIIAFIYDVFIFMTFWHRFGTETTTLLIYFIYMVLAPCMKIYKVKSFALTISKSNKQRGDFYNRKCMIRSSILRTTLLVYAAKYFSQNPRAVGLKLSKSTPSLV